ncbi:hypothetical protein H2200_003034 [Cladophialophora chaetospira]|uniref:NACHT domain-containing protein n=1 Tax=Cladophialophora chaetospira TaxID=386627 RepID=A0AA38XGK6_9EURO|nr:hypothetical protein H2200_003034 [Cladophialophora chaetospira]
MASGIQTTQYLSQPSKPESTEELVSRLTNPETPEKEKKALQALTNTMIEKFEDDRRVSYVAEASELAAVADDHYLRLLLTFQNAIITGTSDKTHLSPELLMRFSSVLQCAGGKEKETMPNKVRVGPVAQSLHVRLQAAVSQAEYQAAYELVQALSSVLDTMNTIKTAGLGWEALHGPLLTQLSDLRKHKEPRLAQAAAYAYQALRGIPDDESPLGKFWRHFKAISTPIATVAGAVSTMDPSKFLTALENLGELKEVIDTMVEAVKNVSDAYNDLGSAFRDGPTRKRRWYLALRYTDLLINAEAFVNLKDFVDRVPCSQQKEFLCGLYAQLEQAWGTVPSPKLKIVDFLENFLIPKGLESDDEIVHEWVKLVADTVGRPDWESDIKPQEHRWHLRKKKKYVPKIATSQSPNQTAAAQLLKKAWDDCSEAKVFYADACIRQHYTAGSRLHIERVSGRLLAMDRCFINLAILEQAEKKVGGAMNSADQTSPFTLATRLQIQEPGREEQVTLPELFSARKWDDGQLNSPRRILIHGRAGVGKTTLCKKMVYDFVHDGMWHDLYDRMLWVPLRNLKQRHGTGYNLEQLFYDEFFASKGEDVGVAYAKALWKRVSTNGDKTLFILDGLDEVYLELGQENEMSHFLNDLLVQSRVIITSRPHVNLPLALDPTNSNKRYLKLETVGFFPDQVGAYIKSAFTDSKTGTTDAEKYNCVQSFIQGRSLVHSLCRIPIQLDLLCYTWDQSSENKPLSTMTRLYENIELRLWQKDLSRKGQGTKDKLLRTNRLMIEKASFAGPYIPVLEALAFSGLCSNTQEFTYAQREVVYREFSPAVTDPEVEDLSFLRTSNGLSEQLNWDYHFLHLTFQEYFAARYLVRQWLAGQDLTCLDLNNSIAKSSRMTPARFIEEEKYNPSYNILWRFVTGLLSSGRHEEKLCKLFQIFEPEPRDLLGPVHQRLVIHCLSEVQSYEDLENFARLRRGLEHQLSQWVLFECKTEKFSRLVRETEFPEDILEETLKNASEDTKVRLLRSLQRSLNMTPQIKKLAALWIQDAGSVALKVAALGVFHPPSEAPPDVLAAAADQLDHQDFQVKIAAAQVLCRDPTLSIWDFHSLKKALEEPKVQRQFNEVLRGRIKFSRAILQSYGEKSEDTRQAVLKVIGSSSSVPGEVIQTLAGQTREADATLAIAAAEALYGQSSLSFEVLQALVKLLQHFEPTVKVAVLRALTAQPTLPEELLLIIAELLRDPDEGVSFEAARVLDLQPVLSEEVHTVLEGQLEDTDLREKEATLRALGGRSPLSKRTVHSLERLARSSEPKLMQLAVEALDRRSAVSGPLLEHLVNLLTSCKQSLKFTAIKALADLSTMPEKVMNVLVKALEDPDPHVRSAVLTSLRWKSDLPQNILNALEKQLEHPESRTAAAKALGNQSNLSTELLRALAKYLGNTGPDVSTDQDFVVAIVNALGTQSDLPEQLVEDLSKWLTVKDGYIRARVIHALGRQATLPTKVFIALVEMLAEDYYTIRNAAVTAVDRHLLRNAVHVYSVLSRIEERYFKFYLACQRQNSFHEHSYWYIKDGELYINTPQGSAHTPLDASQQEQLRKLFHLLRIEEPETPYP